MQNIKIMDEYEAVKEDNTIYMRVSEICRMLELSRVAVDFAFARALERGFVKDKDKRHFTIEIAHPHTGIQTRNIKHYSLHAVIVTAMRTDKVSPKVIAFQNWVFDAIEAEFDKAFERLKNVPR